MRRSAAALAFTVLLALGASASLAPPALATAPPGPLSGTMRVPAPVSTTASMALAVGIFNDPGTVTQAALWVADCVVRLMDYLDDVFEHLKEDVRRARHPQRWPRILPIPPPEISDPLPSRRVQ